MIALFGGSDIVKHRTLPLRLLMCSGLGLLLILGVYVSLGGNPYHRIGYALTMSLLPGCAALAWAVASRRPWSWLRTVSVYALLFFLTILIQGFARTL